MSASDRFWFLAFPYVATFAFVAGTWWRYRNSGFTVSSLSSSFLEARQAFWGAVPFHFGLLLVLLAHLVWFLTPSAVLAWNAAPLRLYATEALLLGCALCTLWGLAVLLRRRLTSSRLRVVTTPVDLAVEVLILAQVVLGIYTAVHYRWGSSWFSAVLTPYLWSLVRLSPEADAVAALPMAVKLHIIGGFSILLLVPFSRLVHIVVAPLHYIARPYQRVVWYRDRRLVRDPSAGWLVSPPRNN